LNSEAASSRIKNRDYLALALCAFILYWFSSFILAANNAATHFGADTWHYSELAKDDVFGRVAENYLLERIMRFHALTVVAAVGWMKAFGPLSIWLTPLQILKAMFALIGALGICAAAAAFNRFLPRREALLCSIIYTVSLAVWYFSSIEESKIVTASLTALYVAIYLAHRDAASARGIGLLTIALLLGCLNEIVFAFVVVLPLADTIVKHRLRWRHYRWIFLHALAAPLALILVEGVLFRRLPAVTHPEEASHFAMLFHYLQRSYYSFATLYEFAANWFCFNVLAPAGGVDSKGYFQPLLVNYLNSAAAIGAITAFCVMVVATLLPRYRAENPTLPIGIVAGLLAFSFVRAGFFFLFDPAEPLLFSAPVVLAHLLLVLTPFAASRFRARSLLLAAFAALVFINNGLLVLRLPNVTP
jgi:hypothetical protein